jgi:hypothetical protein
LQSQELANVYHAHAMLARQGADIDEALSAKLERTAVALADSMTPQAVANVLWAAAEVRKPEYGSAAISTPPALPFMAARRAEHVACAMTPQAVAMTLSALANLNEALLPSMRAALLRTAQQVAPGMNAQAVSNTLWVLATLGEAMPASLRGALHGAALRVAPEMNPQEVANTLWALATLGERLSPALKLALLAAVRRTTADMLPLEVSSTLLALSLLALSLLALSEPLAGPLQAALLPAVERHSVQHGRTGPRQRAAGGCVVPGQPGQDHAIRVAGSAPAGQRQHAPGARAERPFTGATQPMFPTCARCLDRGDRISDAAAGIVKFRMCQAAAFRVKY